MASNRHQGTQRAAFSVFARTIASLVILTTCGRDASGPVAPEQALRASSVQSASAKKLTLSVQLAGTGDGKVKSSPEGIDCEKDHECKASYASGTSVTLKATAEERSVFAGWSGACSGAGNCTITMDAARSVTATFTRLPQFRLAVTLAGTGNGMVKSSPKGVACGGTAEHGESEGNDEHGNSGHSEGDSAENCQETYNQGTVVTLTATAIGGSVFTGWSGACSGTLATCTVTMSVARSVTATFNRNAPTTFALTVTKDGTGIGTVTSAPAGIDCGVVCAASFTQGAVVTLTATPGPHASFVQWSGACADKTPTCVVTMDAAKSVTATFVPEQVPLLLSVVGSGSIAQNGAITCDATGTCASTADYGTTVTLTPTADANFTFTGWSGDCTGMGACSVVMDQAHAVTATFISSLLTVTVSKTGVGGGTISTIGQGIMCGPICSASYAAGTVVMLSVIPDPGSTFVEWTGPCTGTGLSCTFTVTTNTTVTAMFGPQAPSEYILATGMAGTGTGVVSSSPAGIACGLTCSAPFAPGTVVALTAIPNPGSTFAGWTGACSGTAACSVTIDAAKSVTATFNVRPPLVFYDLDVMIDGAGGGSVTSTPGDIDCPAGSCSTSVPAGTLVTLVATPALHSAFVQWNGGGCGKEATCELTMAAATLVTATFAVEQFPLTLTIVGSGSIEQNGVVACDATGTCANSVDYGATVALTPTADANFTFTGWSGDCTGMGTCTVVMDQARAVTATFASSLLTVTVSKTGTGGGTVSTNGPGAGIFCGPVCSTSYAFGTMVVLNAVSDATSQFAGWSGPCSGIGLCAFTVTANTTIGASFTSRIPSPPTLYNAPVSGSTTKTTNWLVTISGVAGATFTCSLDSAPFTACASPFALNVTANSFHTLSVKQTVAGGFTSAATTVTWTVDNTAPIIQLSISPSGTTTSTTATVSFVIGESDTFNQCSLDGGAFGACVSPVVLTNLSVGTHTYAVRATDIAGNMSVATVTWVVTGDTPVLPPVLSAAPTSISFPLTIVGASSPPTTVTVTNSGGSTTSALSLATSGANAGQFVITTGTCGGATLAPGASCTATVTFAPTGASGLRSGSFVITGGAGSQATVTLTGNADVPPPPVLSAAPTSISFPLTMVGASSPPSTVTVTNTGGSTTSALSLATGGADASQFVITAGTCGGATLAVGASCEAAVTFAPTGASGLRSGSFVITGGAGSQATVTLTGTADVLTVAPPPPTLTNAPIDGSTTQVMNWAIVISGVANATFACSVDNLPYTACANPYALHTTPDGAHTLRVTQTVAGSTSAPTSRSWTVDNTAPIVQLSISPSGVTSSTTATATFIVSESTMLNQCSLDGGAFVACVSPVALTNLSVGTHTYAVRATDLAGNMSAVTVTWAVTGTASVSDFSAALFRTTITRSAEQLSTLW